MDLNKATRDFKERKCQCAKCLAEENHEPCDCETAKADRALGDSGSKDGPSCGHKNAASQATAGECGIDPKAPCALDDNPATRGNKDDSNNSDNPRIIFGGTTFGRKSSINEPIKPIMQGQLAKARVGCQGVEYDEIGISGRDTLGSPIYLRGGLLKSDMGGRCARDRACELNCGMDTGCGKDCRTSKLPGKAGVRVCSNEMVNTTVSFLLEGVGILVFFAVCTITFWVALGYYMAQLVVNLKKADRNVHVAISIVLGMLMLMFAITMVTHGQQRSKSLGITGKAKGLASHLPGRGSTQKVKPKGLSMVMPKMKPKAAKNLGKMKRKYTDCQGRAIYNTARRNSVVIEMKQPPTWLIWLNDFLNDFMNNR